MTPEEFRVLFDAKSEALSSMALACTIVTVALSGAAAFLGAYLAEKARNTATKEDIEDITHKIERTKVEYSKQLEELKGTYQLHSVSALKRMDALQGAYVRWTALIRSVHSSNLNDEHGSTSKWLLENCIYLSAEVRSALDEALMAAFLHKGMLEARLPKNEIEENWAKIRRVSDVILAEANLPPIPKGQFPEIDEAKKA